MKLNVFTPMRLDENHPSPLIELSDVIVRLLPAIDNKTRCLTCVHPSGVSKRYTHLKKGTKEYVESYRGQPHLEPWKDHGPHPSVINFWIYEEQEDRDLRTPSYRTSLYGDWCTSCSAETHVGLQGEGGRTKEFFGGNDFKFGPGKRLAFWEYEEIS